MQILSMITYAIVFVCYLNVLRSFKGSTIKVVFLDGAARLIIPIVIIILDLRIKEFTRRFQFLLSLGLFERFGRLQFNNFNHFEGPLIYAV